MKIRKSLGRFLPLSLKFTRKTFFSDGLRQYCIGNIGKKWVKPLSANPTKWPNTLKQFGGFCRRTV